MQIPLEELAGEAQREFLDHFVAALRRNGGYGGSSWFNPDGSFEVSLSCTLSVGDASASLLWKWVRDRNGSVDALTVVPEEGAGCAAEGWQDAARDLVHRALLMALKKKREEFFVRDTYFYIGPNLDGEYWLSGTRVAPAICEEAQPALINCERALHIDQKVPGIDAAHALELGRERAKRIAARLSLLLNVGLYHVAPDLRFVLSYDDTSADAAPRRMHLGFRDRRPPPRAMPRKGEDCHPGSPLPPGTDEIRFWGDNLRLPGETRRIFRAADNPSHLFGEAFDACSRLYQVSLVAGKHFRTVRLAYQVAAVEAITKSDPSLSGFPAFMRRFTPPSEGLDVFLDYLWGPVRSAHFHAGKFPLGDFLASGFDLTSPESMERNTIAFEAPLLIRQAILAWARESSAAIDPDSRKQSA
ncbi:MAG TPA: hypothetical protein VEQ60_21285 [Longimicrobium sp.]|nr:hypothetical protein [Longimicrobium sp.]